MDKWNKKARKICNKYSRKVAPGMIPFWDEIEKEISGFGKKCAREAYEKAAKAMDMAMADYDTKTDTLIPDAENDFSIIIRGIAEDECPQPTNSGQTSPNTTDSTVPLA